MADKCVLKGSRKVGAELQQWHGSMGDPIYQVGSHWYAGLPVSCDAAVHALKNLKTLRFAKLSTKERRSLDICIRAVQSALAKKGWRP